MDTTSPRNTRDWHGFHALLARGVWLTPLLLAIPLVAAGFHNYLLFHTLVELMTIIVGVLMFVVAVYTYPYSRENFLMFLAIGYFWIAAIDLFHALFYKGMDIVAADTSNLATQFWLAGRFMQAFLLLLAPFLITKRMHTAIHFILFGVLSTVFYILIIGGYFPDAYIEGEGLTPFKIISEYLVCLILLLALANLYIHRKQLKPDVFPFLAAAIVFTICSELAFTNYISVYGPANMLGHLFKLLAFWLVFYSIVRTSLQEPYEAVIQATRAMKVSEGKYRNLVEVTSDWIWEVNRHGTYTYVSPKVRDILGYEPEEILGKSPFDLMPPEEARSVAKGLSPLMQSGQPFQGVKNRNRHKNGKTITLETSGVPFFDDRGALAGYRGIDRDITEHEKLEEQFHQSQKMEAVGTLVGGIAHDFNNTLAGIAGNLFLARKAATGLPEVIARLDNAEKLSFRAADMIKQLLTFSRQGAMQSNPIAMTPFLKEVIKLEEVVIPENIELQHHIRDIAFPVQGDLNLLQQALINLINNARDAVQNIPKPTISIELKQVTVDEAFSRKHSGIKPGEAALVSISDNGMGISRENLEHIFEPFFTTKPVGAGTGLGLAMVYGAVRSHGGTIEASSEEGKGTVFHLYLPLARKKYDDAQPVPADQVTGGRGETILLVDDEENVLSTGRDVLKNLNYNVLTAANGKAAVELYTEHKDDIDLVILDVVMSKMGGVEALQQIRRLNPGQKALFATGYESEKSGNERQATTSDPVINKPFTIGALSRAIRNQLD